MTGEHPSTPVGIGDSNSSVSLNDLHGTHPAGQKATIDGEGIAETTEGPQRRASSESSSAGVATTSTVTIPAKIDLEQIQSIAWNAKAAGSNNGAGILKECSCNVLGWCLSGETESYRPRDMSAILWRARRRSLSCCCYGWYNYCDFGCFCSPRYYCRRTPLAYLLAR